MVQINLLVYFCLVVLVLSLNNEIVEGKGRGSGRSGSSSRSSSGSYSSRSSPSSNSYSSSYSGRSVYSSSSSSSQNSKPSSSSSSGSGSSTWSKPITWHMPASSSYSHTFTPREKLQSGSTSRLNNDQSRKRNEDTVPDLLNLEELIRSSSSINKPSAPSLDWSTGQPHSSAKFKSSAPSGVSDPIGWNLPYQSPKIASEVKKENVGLLGTSHHSSSGNAPGSTGSSQIGWVANQDSRFQPQNIPAPSAQSQTYVSSFHSSQSSHNQPNPSHLSLPNQQPLVQPNPSNLGPPPPYPGSMISSGGSHSIGWNVNPQGTAQQSSSGNSQRTGGPGHIGWETNQDSRFQSQNIPAQSAQSQTYVSPLHSSQLGQNQPNPSHLSISKQQSTGLSQPNPSNLGPPPPYPGLQTQAQHPNIGPPPAYPGVLPQHNSAAQNSPHSSHISPPPPYSGPSPSQVNQPQIIQGPQATYPGIRKPLYPVQAPTYYGTGFTTSYIPPPPPPGYSYHAYPTFHAKQDSKYKDVLTGVALWQLSKRSNHHHHHHYNHNPSGGSNSYEYEEPYISYQLNFDPKPNVVGSHNTVIITHFVSNTTSKNNVLVGTMACRTTYNLGVVRRWVNRTKADFRRKYPEEKFPEFNNINDTLQNFTVTPGNIIHNETAIVTCCATSGPPLPLSYLTNGKASNVNCVTQLGKIPLRKMIFDKIDTSDSTTPNPFDGPWVPITLIEPQNVTSNATTKQNPDNLTTTTTSTPDIAITSVFENISSVPVVILNHNKNSTLSTATLSTTQLELNITSESTSANTGVTENPRDVVTV